MPTGNFSAPALTGYPKFPGTAGTSTPTMILIRRPPARCLADTAVFAKCRFLRCSLFRHHPPGTDGHGPQQRLLLEVAWEALEHAGQAAEALFRTPAGVFTGISSFDYAAAQLQSVDIHDINAYLGTGIALSAANGRLSYMLGLTRPSVAVDTACSSSLVAVHLACQSLRARECDLALAGGVNVILLPELSINFSRARMLSPDGRCKTFDASANGYVRGEGCGVIVLKRLSDAVADRDRILALIRGSAVNQDGPERGTDGAKRSGPGGSDPPGPFKRRGKGRGRGVYRGPRNRDIPGRPDRGGGPGKGFRRKAETSRCVIGSVKTNSGIWRRRPGSRG